MILPLLLLQVFAAPFPQSGSTSIDSRGSDPNSLPPPPIDTRIDDRRPIDPISSSSSSIGADSTRTELSRLTARIDRLRDDVTSINSQVSSLTSIGVNTRGITSNFDRIDRDFRDIIDDMRSVSNGGASRSRLL